MDDNFGPEMNKDVSIYYKPESVILLIFLYRTYIVIR